MITSTDGQFILDLAPRHPIYMELVDKAAREAIGMVHRHGAPALGMLEKEGFQRAGLIDIFDGGPTMTCRRDAIRTIAEARVCAVRVADGAGDDAAPHLLSTTSLAGFRATQAPVSFEGGSAILSHETAGLLGIGAGDRVQVSA